MKTNVAQASIRTFHQIGDVLADQDRKVLASMTFGAAYTRRELGILAGIENSAAARCVNGLVKAGLLDEVGERKCSRTARTVGVVSLSIASLSIASL